MSVTPTGAISKPIYELKRLVAACAAFQEWVGAADATEALGSIHEVQYRGTPTRPCALVDQGPGWRFELSPGRGMTSGSLVLILEGAVAAADAPVMSDAFYSFCNAVWAILEEMSVLVLGRQYLMVTAVTLRHGPARADVSDRRKGGDFMQAIFEVEWT